MANEIANVRFRYIIDTGTGLRRQWTPWPEAFFV
jgi:hypothetical protein